MRDIFVGDAVDTTNWLIHGDGATIETGALRIEGNVPWQNGVESRDNFDRAKRGGLVVVSGTVTIPADGARSIGFVQLQERWRSRRAFYHQVEFRFNDEGPGDHRIDCRIQSSGIPTTRETLAHLPQESLVTDRLTWNVSFDDRGVEFWPWRSWHLDEAVERSSFKLILHVQSGAITWEEVSILYYPPQDRLPCPREKYHGWIVRTVTTPNGEPMGGVWLQNTHRRLDPDLYGDLSYSRCWEWESEWTSETQHHTGPDGRFSMYYQARIGADDPAGHEMSLLLFGNYGGMSFMRSFTLPIAKTLLYELPDTTPYDVEFTVDDIQPAPSQ